MSAMPKIQDADILGATVLLRGDLDVPISSGQISDDSRLAASLETIEYLLGENCKVIICGHLGRPNPKNKKDLSLLPIAKWYSKKFDSEIKDATFPNFSGWHIKDNLYLLENLRFEEGEEKNDPDFARELADLAQIYVNDAFASSHRSHASIVSVPQFLSHYSGFQLQKEINALSKALIKPKRPLTVLIGGAKIETKLPLVSKMHGLADHVLVGGEIAEHTRELLKIEHGKTDRKSELSVAELTSDEKDITEESTQKFIEIIKNSQTILWNGPLGLIEECFDLGTREVAKAISESNAYTIVGGGDTVSFLNKEGLLSKFSFVSTGGGAMLEFLSGEDLPGLLALQN